MCQPSSISRLLSLQSPRHLPANAPSSRSECAQYLLLLSLSSRWALILTTAFERCLRQLRGAVGAAQQARLAIARARLLPGRLHGRACHRRARRLRRRAGAAARRRPRTDAAATCRGRAWRRRAK
eukprot:6178181-Pleurochrysis_carterae.AAC.2